MLILSRKCGERIIVGDKIELTVVAIFGNRVQLGVRAPKDVAVHRDEHLGHAIAKGRIFEGNRTIQELCE